MSWNLREFLSRFKIYINNCSVVLLLIKFVTKLSKIFISAENLKNIVWKCKISTEYSLRILNQELKKKTNAGRFVAYEIIVNSFCDLQPIFICIYSKDV